MISPVSQRIFLCSAGMEPVKIWISANKSGRFSLNVFKCCSTKGLVGARTRVFVVGNCFRRWIDSIRAISVLPSPVGKTTRVFACFAVSKIDC